MRISDWSSDVCSSDLGAEVRAPKVVALYGANASGKTTMLRALEFVVTMIRDSVARTVPGFSGIERFNDMESADRPIRFAIELGGIMNLTPEVFQRAMNGEKVAHGTYQIGRASCRERVCQYV